MKASHLQAGEFGSFYQNYINLAGDNDLLESLDTSGKTISEFLESIPENKMNSAYAEGKWTIKEIISHLIDTERVFAYRSLRFARKDSTDLPGFEQDDYVATSKANNRTKNELVEEYKAVRNATLTLFKSFNESMMKNKGSANNNPATPRAMGFIIVGHEIHHARIINERYL